MRKNYRMEGLDCAHCADRIASALAQLQGVRDVSLQFVQQRLSVDLASEEDIALHEAVREIAPSVRLVDLESETEPCGEQDSACHTCHDHAHGHDHAHSHQEGLDRIMLGRILAAGVLFAAGFFVGKGSVAYYALLFAAYACAGYDILWSAGRNLFHGRIFDENFLMAIASVGAVLLGEVSEAVAVMLFYQVGEMFQSLAVGRSRRSIAELMDIKPPVAHVWRNGEVLDVKPEVLQPGEVVWVRPGEKIPVDGVIVDGHSTLDMAALTGESLPRETEPGDAVVSGSINLQGLLQIRVEKRYEDSTAAKILELVEHAGTRKAQTENFITKFARYYTPAVVGLAVMLAVGPPLFVGGWSEWIHRALTFLVISCPCALVISVPLSFFAGIGGASRRGILIKGGNYMEALARAETVVFDKTGTLTKGAFAVSRIRPEGQTGDTLLQMAAYAESASNHPISQSIRAAYGKEIEKSRVQEVMEIPGMGVSALVDGHRVLAGNGKLLDREGIPCPHAWDAAGTTVYVAIDGTFAGTLSIEDVVKEDAAEAVSQLRNLGVKSVVMLTGDAPAAAEGVAAAVGIDSVHAGLLPQEKVEVTERLIASSDGRGTLLFVGDGINDAPVLARADVGIAMGGVGSDSAIEAADVVLMRDEPSKVAAAITISRRTLSIVRQNIVLALGIKCLVLVLGALGLANMWAAVFADVGVSMLAILNAMRALYSR